MLMPCSPGGHRFAWVTAEVVELRAGREAVETAVASPEGLLATKLHAAGHRREGSKRASDLLDLYRLLTDCDNVAMADAVATWPRLAGVVRTELAELFVKQATLTAGRMQTVSAAGEVRITETDVTATAELILDLLAE